MLSDTALEHPAQEPVAVDQLVLEDEADVDGHCDEERDMARHVEGQRVVRDEDEPEPGERHHEEQDIEGALRPVRERPFDAG